MTDTPAPTGPSRPVTASDMHYAARNATEQAVRKLDDALAWLIRANTASPDGLTDDAAALCRAITVARQNLQAALEGERPDDDDT